MEDIFKNCEDLIEDFNQKSDEFIEKLKENEKYDNK